MSSQPGHYDHNLATAAPAVTKQQLQEGYTTDLLNPNHGKATPPLASQTDPEHGQYNKEYSLPKPLPFWRTRKGIIIIIVAAIVILAAVIGGAVGGTAGKKKGSIDEGSPPPKGGESAGESGGETGSTATTPAVNQTTVTTTGTSSAPSASNPPGIVTGPDGNSTLAELAGNNLFGGLQVGSAVP